MQNWSKKLTIGVVLVGLLTAVPTAFAFAGHRSGQHRFGANGQQTAHVKGQRHGAFGKITAISGNTITVQDPKGTSLTIDATSATVTVDKAVSTVSALVVGDQIMVKGTPSTTDATKISATAVFKKTKGFRSIAGKSGNGHRGFRRGMMKKPQA